jgi:hypothetical protein
MGALHGKAFRDGSTDSARGSGHNGDLARKVSLSHQPASSRQFSSGRPILSPVILPNAGDFDELGGTTVSTACAPGELASG